MTKDKRNRVRFTYQGVRFQISPNGKLRTYRRYSPHANAERVYQDAPVTMLDRAGRNKLWQAILVARHPEYSR